MKKLLLSVLGLALLSNISEAQQRLVLFEEFSGENCGPCAAANPALMQRINANPSKVVLLKYQSPIPTAGPIYQQNTADVNARGTYYNVSSAPSGYADGKVPGTGASPTHVNHFTQAAIDAAAAVASPFNMTVTHNWSADYDSIYATVTVSAVQNYAPAGAQLKLRLALAEHLVFATPPGTNGEKEFHNVMRKMYPNATGTVISNSWTAGDTQTFTIGGPAPAYVDKSSNPFMIAWIQNDTNKEVAQAAKSAPVTIASDVASVELKFPNSLLCASASTTLNGTVTLKNTGTTPLTSANIYIRVNNGAWQSQSWTGSLAPNATVDVNLPALNVTPGRVVITDSVSTPNGAADVNPANNISTALVWVHNSALTTLPFTTTFENNGAVPANWTFYDVNKNQNNWIVGATSGNIGYNNSKFVIAHQNYNYEIGEVNYAIMPTAALPAGPKTLTFYVAHARYQTSNDKLEVVYSTNCGQSWISAWTQQGAALSTAPATTSFYLPAQNDWQLRTVDLTNVPAGAIIAFKATSDYGNNVFVDDVTLMAGTTGIEEVLSLASTTLFPNPAHDQATLSFELSEDAAIQVQVLDLAGRVVENVANQRMNAGKNQVTISTEKLASGLYHVKIQSEKGTQLKKLSVVK